jgi:hypothetical protein
VSWPAFARANPHPCRSMCGWTGKGVRPPRRFGSSSCVPRQRSSGWRARRGTRTPPHARASRGGAGGAPEVHRLASGGWPASIGTRRRIESRVLTRRLAADLIDSAERLRLASSSAISRLQTEAILPRHACLEIAPSWSSEKAWIGLPRRRAAHPLCSFSGRGGRVARVLGVLGRPWWDVAVEPTSWASQKEKGAGRRGSLP